jgi:hypothetical protein
LKIAMMFIASMAILLCANDLSFAQMTDVDRRLHVALLGFELNEAAAKDALAAGANVNVKNEAMNGETMLITAIKGFKDVKVVRFLLDNGADPAIKDESGKTALNWAQQYNIGRDRNGREILKLLEGATIQPAEQSATKTDKPVVSPKQDATTKTAPATTTATTKKPRRSVGPPTTEEVKETMEKSFTGIYESHFYGVKNKVTFEWVGAITVGGLQTVRAAPKACYPVKLKIIVTAEDPRDGNTSTVTRGLGSTAGNYKEEIFCFYRDGFGEWAYGTYGK